MFLLSGLFRCNMEGIAPFDEMGSLNFILKTTQKKKIRQTFRFPIYGPFSRRRTGKAL